MPRHAGDCCPSGGKLGHQLDEDVVPRTDDDVVESRSGQLLLQLLKQEQIGAVGAATRQNPDRPPKPNVEDAAHVGADHHDVVRTDPHEGFIVSLQHHHVGDSEPACSDQVLNVQDMQPATATCECQHGPPLS